MKSSLKGKCVLVGLSVTKALNKVIQRCKHATHAAVIHHIGSADSFSVYQSEVMSHVLRNYITKDLSNTNIINCFNISDLHDVENNPLVGMLAILTYNESVFQPYQFA